MRSNVVNIEMRLPAKGESVTLETPLGKLTVEPDAPCSVSANAHFKVPGARPKMWVHFMLVCYNGPWTVAGGITMVRADWSERLDRIPKPERGYGEKELNRACGKFDMNAYRLARSTAIRAVRRWVRHHPEAFLFLDLESIRAYLFGDLLDDLSYDRRSYEDFIDCVGEIVADVTKVAEMLGRRAVAERLAQVRPALERHRNKRTIDRQLGAIYQCAEELSATKTGAPKPKLLRAA